MSVSSARPMRADARRNRDAILLAARQVFEHEGIYAPIDGIASVAGVGNATLYRNFPTRDDLLAAVMSDSVDTLLRWSEPLGRELPPDQALGEWLFRLAWHLRIWHDMPTCVATAMAASNSPVQDVCAGLVDRIDELLAAARADGPVAASVTGASLFELATTLSWGIDRYGDDEPRARERVALATAGIFRSS